MPRYFQGTYYNNYCGCDESRFFIADDFEQVESAMSEGLCDYAMDYFDYSTGRIEEDEDNMYGDDGWDEYFEGCGFNCEEVNPEEVEEEYSSIDWEDLTGKS